MERINVKLGDRSYPISIGAELFNDPALFSSAISAGRRVVVVSNETVAPLYADKVMATIRSLQCDVALLSLPDGEQYKTLDTFNQIMTFLLDGNYGRDVVIVATVSAIYGLGDPSTYHSMVMHLIRGEQIKQRDLIRRLAELQYSRNEIELQRATYRVRGEVIDVYPAESDREAVRIELFDDEVETIRTLDSESQRSLEKVEQIRLLPAREYPFDKAAITRFRESFRSQIEGDPKKSNVYRDVTNGISPPGIEYYLPLFYPQTQSLFDYLPENTLLFTTESVEEAAEGFWRECAERYQY